MGEGSASSFVLRLAVILRSAVTKALSPRPFPAISAARQRRLGGRNFSSDKKEQAQRLPLAVYLPRLRPTTKHFSRFPFAVILRNKTAKNGSPSLAFGGMNLVAFAGGRPFSLCVLRCLAVILRSAATKDLSSCPATFNLPPTAAVSSARSVAEAMAGPVAHQAASARRARHSARCPAYTPA
jgi:hypothetical protein